MGPGNESRDDGGLWGSGCEAASAPEGAILISHGETIAGLSRLLKDGPEGRRDAAGRRPVLDHPGQTGTLQPPRDVRLGATRGRRKCNLLENLKGSRCKR